MVTQERTRRLSGARSTRRGRRDRTDFNMSKSPIMSKNMRFWHLLLIILVILCHVDASSEHESDQKHPKPSREPKKVISLAESIQKSRKVLEDPAYGNKRKLYWKKTLDEIRQLSLGFPKTSEKHGGGGTFLSQWKLISSKTNLTANGIPKSRMRRFEGFRSWDGLMQEWKEEVQEYIEEAEAEATTNVQELQDFSLPALSVLEEEPSGKKKAKLPQPAPAKLGQEVVPHTDLRDKSKRIEIVTTASLPWMTGTAVNPLLRAVYLVQGRKEVGGSVTLMLPWLERASDQTRVYGKNKTFDTPEDQEGFIRTWLRESAKMEEAADELRIRWYTAWQNPAENSVYSMGDITALIPADEVDICILEEPEHLNWYRAPGESWTKKFKHVVGIMHTNYFQYALDQPAAIIRAPAMRLLVSWMCRAHCHRLIKLSGTLDVVAPEKELVENVHGVRRAFIDTGLTVRDRLQISGGKEYDPVFGASAEPTAYFIGKMLWSKGLGSLMELLKYAEETADIHIKVDMYGGGPDMKAASAKSESMKLDMPFHGPIDHAELAFEHKIFVNPSTSEVLCTTTAEAIAMGKFAIIPSHPSNDFFAQFPNCLTYATKEEFVGNLYYAMTHAPEPLSEVYSHALSWKAATERLEAAGCIPKEEADLLAEAADDLAGVEITLPPLVEDEEQRKVLEATLRYTKLRFIKFRSQLANDIRQNKVLPKVMRERMLNELAKSLDFDVNEIVNSPKLRLKLSPAELDKSLLDLHDRISESPSGDLLRVIGGGGQIGLQNLYVKRQAQRNRKKGLKDIPEYDLFYLASELEAKEAEIQDVNQSVSESVRRALARNMKSTNGVSPSSTSKSMKDKTSTPRMCLGTGSKHAYINGVALPTRQRFGSSFCQRSSTARFSLLI